MNPLGESFVSFFNAFGFIVSAYLPKFLAGILILFIGLTIASIFKDIVKLFFKYLRVEKWLATAGIVREEDVKIWPVLLAELIRWTIIFIFLTSAVEAWGIPRVGEVLNQLLVFLPNVLTAVIIGFIGMVVARLFADIVRHSLRGLGEKEAVILGQVGRYSIIFFTGLIILTQLGVAAELVKILFTGIIGMLALAFGLAFGLGGQEEAKDILKSLRRKIEKRKK